MTQPTPYEVTTDFSQEEANQVSGRSTVRTAKIDAEFDNLALTLGQILANLQLIQRDDGELADRSVRLAQLSNEVLALLVSYGATPRGVWVTNTGYAVKDIVTVGLNSYMGVSAHTSGADFATDLAADKWLILSNASPSASGQSFSPSGALSATNVQDAIDEVNNELRPSANLFAYINNGGF
jgi:hypothetical protein